MIHVLFILLLVIIILSKWAYAQTAALEGCFILAEEEVSGV